MPSNSIRTILQAVALFLTSNVIATPQIAFPINSQLPPVAYVSQPFEFSFSPGTFIGDTPDVSYALSRQPTWLSLESSSRKLLGTPSSADVGAPTFDLIASDSSGQISSSITLIVLQEQRLSSQNGELLSQLSKAGSVSAPATLLLRSQQSFAFSLEASIFNGSSADTAYYAVSSDGSPLPSWIQFDSTMIHFTGTTPPSRAPEPSGQTFPFKLAASNVVGFSEASLQFDLLISDRTLAFTNALFNFSIFKGSTLQTQSLLQYVVIDGVAATRDQLTFVNANLPSWLRLDDTTLSLAGSVPDDIKSSTFSISVGATGTNIANTTISLQVEGQQNISQTDLGIVYAVDGTYFNYKLNPPSALISSENITVMVTDSPGWMSFTESNLTIHGPVPQNYSTGESRVLLTFSNAAETVNSSLTIAYTRPMVYPTNTGTTTLTSGLATSSPESGAHTTSGPKATALILSIVLPIFALITLLCILIAWMWKPKREQKQQDAVTKTNSPSQPPMRRVGSENKDDLLMLGSAQPYESIVETTSGAPHVELPWAPDSIRKSRDRLLRKSRASQSSAVGSSWDDLVDYRAQSKDHLPPMPTTTFRPRKDSGVPISSISQPFRIPPTRPPRPPSPGMPLLSKRLRTSNSQQVSMPQNGSSKRLSGVGHGSGRGWNAHQANPRSSWQTTLSTIPMVESRPSVVMMGSFPAPPSNVSLNATSVTYGNLAQHESESKPTMKLVQSNSNDSGSFETTNRNQSSRQEESQANEWENTSRFTSKRAVVPIVEQDDWDTYETPALPQRSLARPRGNSASEQGNGHRYSQGAAALGLETSAASSRQFDSAISSDSQWDDDNPKANSNNDEKEQWRAIGLTSTNRPPPRLADQRRQVSIEQGKLERSQRSQKGSLRFI